MQIIDHLVFRKAIVITVKSIIDVLSHQFLNVLQLLSNCLKKRKKKRGSESNQINNNKLSLRLLPCILNFENSDFLKDKIEKRLISQSIIGTLIIKLRSFEEKLKVLLKKPFFSRDC